MIRELFISVGGIAGTGFFGTWGISQAVNTSKNDGLGWLREGADTIIGASKRTKGIAVKIPESTFELDCNSLNSLKEGCEDLNKALKDVNYLMKNTGVGLGDEIKDEDKKWLGDNKCGIIAWNTKEKEQKTNLLGLAKFLIRVYCLESKVHGQGENFRNEFIWELNKNQDVIASGDLVAGVFSTGKVWDNSGKTLIKSEVSEYIKKLIKNEGEKLTKWIETLSKLVDKELSLRIVNASKGIENNKWLIIQQENKFKKS